MDQLDEDGRRLVVRNGHHDPRTVTTAAWAIEVRAPRVNDKRTDEATGQQTRRFASAILPAWCRRSPKGSEVLPLLYLHGLYVEDLVAAIEECLGTGAGLSSSTIGRLGEHWVNLHTTNPIQSTFATVRQRTKLNRRPGSKAAGLAMAFKLILAAQERWRAVNAPHLVALVRACATFVNGNVIERSEDQQAVTPPVETAA